MWKIKDSLPIKVGIISFSNLDISKDDIAYKQILDRAKIYFDLYKDTNVGEIPGIQIARDFFRAIGLDPTKRRPSSEALLRRALHNKGFFRVNTLVDAANYCSLDFLLPICVYDADKIEEDVEIRQGVDGEKYHALTGNELNLQGRYVIADRQGPFGSPITDSIRSAVSEMTSNAIVCIFASNQLPDETLKSYMDKTAANISEFCGGRCLERQILQG